MIADRVAAGGVLAAALLLVAVLVAVYAFIASRSLTIFSKIAPWDYLFVDRWLPFPSPGVQPGYGAAGIIAGSLIVVAMAVVLATPLSLGAALFLEQTDARLGDRILRPVLEVFVGIPSVVYGWLGLTQLVPIVRRLEGGGTGLSVLSAGLVLTVMILPTVTTLSADAIKRVPAALAEASYALGATRWQTIWRCVLPAARSGITTGVVLGTARALGEALAVAMVIGGVARLPSSLFSPGATMTTIIAVDLPNRALSADLNYALYTMALILLLLSLLLIVIIRRVSGGFEAR